MGNTYIFKILLYLDILVSGLIWRDPGITISARCGLELRNYAPALWARIIGGFLNFISKNHCDNAIVSDMKRASEALAILSAAPIVPRSWSGKGPR